MLEKTARKEKSKPPVVGIEEVAATCGHMVKFENFEDKKDKYREQRRKKITEKPCGPCRIEAAKAKMEAERNPIPKNQRPSQIRHRRHKFIACLAQRLPDQSEFHVTFDARTQSWEGTLTVQGTVFTDSKSGVFKLLRKLDEKYRAARALIEIN